MIYLLKIVISQFAMLNNQRVNPHEIPKSAMIFAGDTSEEPLCLAWDLACSARPGSGIAAVAAAPSGAAGTGSGRRSFLGQGGDVGSIWVNYNELTTSSLEIIVSKGNHPQMALIQVSELL